MKKGIVRRIAVYLAFFQLFSASAKASTNYVLVDNTNENNPIYQLYDTETEEYSNISIFYEKNVASKQYGANQAVFSTLYGRLIQDPLIWEELQNYWPWQDFDSKYEAKLFYEHLFEKISESSCGHAAATNYIFQLFEGKEQKFYDTFGFPMYTVTGNFVDFNYEIMMFKFFNYFIKTTKQTNKLRDNIMKKVYEEELEYYNNLRDEHKEDFDEFKSWTKEQYKEWQEENDLYIKKIKEITNKLKKISKLDYKYGFGADEKFGNLVSFLRQYKINIKCVVKSGSRGAKANDIIGADGYTLYEKSFSNLEGYDYSGTDGHYVYVTGRTEDNKIIVSSWGNKYIFEDTNPEHTNTVIIKKLK